MGHIELAAPVSHIWYFKGIPSRIGLMLDMVFNHTSTEHEWFKKALAGDKKYQDYYIFKDGTPDCYPTNWVSKFGGPRGNTYHGSANGICTCSM